MSDQDDRIEEITKPIRKAAWQKKANHTPPSRITRQITTFYHDPGKPPETEAVPEGHTVVVLSPEDRAERSRVYNELAALHRTSVPGSRESFAIRDARKILAEGGQNG